MIAEIFSRYFPSDINMHTFEYHESMKNKRNNWGQLIVFFKRRDLPILIKNVDSLVTNEGNATIEFVKQVYTLLTERVLMPPIKVYETEQESLLLKDKEMVKLPNADDDEVEEDDKKEQTVMNETSSRSP